MYYLVFNNQENYYTSYKKNPGESNILLLKI